MLVTLTYLYIGFLVFASFPSPPLSKDCIEQVRHCAQLCDFVCVAGKTEQEQDQSGLDVNAASTRPLHVSNFSCTQSQHMQAPFDNFWSKLCIPHSL